MRRLIVILVVLVAGLVTSLGFVAIMWPHQTLMGGMMGGMMGGRGMMGPFDEIAFMFWPLIITVSLVSAVTIVGYTLLFPEIPRTANTSRDGSTSLDVNPPASAVEAVLRVLKPDERKVLQLLADEGGQCLQRDITRKTGLSKLKTHRVVVRLAERQLAVVSKHGRTNQVRLPAWLLGKAEVETAQKLS